MGLEGIQGYLVGIVLAMVVFTGGIFIMGTYYSNSPTIDSNNQVAQFNLGMNKTIEITNTVGGMESSLSSVSEENVGLLGWLNILVGSAFKGVKAIFSSLGFMKDLGASAAGIFGIPAFIVNLLLLIASIIIIIAIWSAITKT
jgi:hypothetical protein